MEDYPKTLGKFEARFSSEGACREYLLQLRWPQGVSCPRCECRKVWETIRGLLVCASCSYHISVTAGTIFERTRKPLTIWFRTMWWVTSQKTGVSALGLQQVLGLGSYHTAWTWLHKLRRAMVRPGRDRLSGCHRGKLFYRLVQQEVAIEPTPYKDMVKNVRGPRPRKYAI